MAGTSSGVISVPDNSLGKISITPLASLIMPEIDFEIWIFAPIRNITVRSPVLVGFKPTFSRTMPSFTPPKVASPIKKAADEKSPGISTSNGSNLLGGESILICHLFSLFLSRIRIPALSKSRSV